MVVMPHTAVTSSYQFSGFNSLYFQGYNAPKLSWLIFSSILGCFRDMHLLFQKHCCYFTTVFPYLKNLLSK